MEQKQRTARRYDPSKLFSLDLLLTLTTARNNQKQPEAARSSHEQPGAAQEQPAAARSSQEQAKNSQGQPGTARDAENKHRARAGAL
jgi:hypothetical protein